MYDAYTVSVCVQFNVCFLILIKQLTTNQFRLFQIREWLLHIHVFAGQLYFDIF